MEKQLQPKLRFPEFEDEWQNKRLADVITFKAGYAFKSNNMNNNGGTYQIIKMSNVYQNKLQLDRNSSYISDISIKEKEFLLSKGNLVLTLTGTVGKTDYGYSVQINENDKYLLNQRLVALKCINGKSINDYNKQVLLNQRFLYKFFNESKGGTGNQTNVSIEDVKNIKLLFPSLPEQQKIADYLTTIDKKIELLEEKKTELSRYKKAMMQKLFAQEIRFKDENGNDYPEWEEKRLGEVFNSYNGLTGKTKENFGFGKPYIKYTQVFGSSKIDVGGFDLVEITANDKQNQAQYGDAFFTVSSETPHEVGMSSVLLDEVDEVYLNSFCFGIRPKSKNLNPHYYRYFFRSKNFRKEVVKLAQGSTRYNMSKVEFMKINIEIPSLPEQQKIADFLSSIDESITKVEEQIMETQNFKKAMLQQLFV